MRKAWRGKDRDLLSSYERRQRVYHRDAGQDRFGGGLPAARVQRCSADRRGDRAGHGRSAVQRFSPAVTDPAEPAVTDRDAQRLSAEGHPQAVPGHRVGALEEWNEIERVVPREKLTVAVATIAAFVPETDDDAAAA
ncbi:MAG TPA: hypothetical protein VE198_12600 [Actinoallomurus sp.]|nr:hypothetical protein [Actinoallomurus sp.]